MMPNARLAGLLRKEKDDDGQPLVPFVFAEVQLPRALTGLRTEIAQQNRVEPVGVCLRPAPQYRLHRRDL